MEIIAEILFSILGAVVEFVFSIAFQIVAEFFAHIFGYSRAKGKPLSATMMRVAAVAAYVFGGVLAGFLSLWLAPKLMLDQNWQRIVNLLLMPVVVGLSMQMWDNWKYQSGKPASALPGFARGYLFALVMTGVRLIWGKS